MAGFELYAEIIAKMLNTKPAVLYDLLEGLLHVAVADNNFKDEENLFLNIVPEHHGLQSLTKCGS